MGGQTGVFAVGPPHYPLAFSMSTARRRHLGRKTTGVCATPATFARYAVGDLVGEKYRLVELRGQGGMGVVWVAHDRVLDVPVAVKLLDLEKQKDAKSLGRRLLEEARAAARLGHASIVRVHDFGVTRQGDPFLVMELLEGEDLAAVLEREERLDGLKAVQLVLPIADALGAAHEKGIVHRDVKPENIFLALDPSGILPKLLDFGIARSLDRPTKLTLEGSLLGTPDYMSPEQARGETAEAQTDQWSLCVVLHELVTGVCPFVGDNYNALLRSIIEDTPRPFTDYGLGDSELWHIVSRGLEKSPASRFASVHDLGRSLASWLMERGIHEDTMGTSLRRRWFPELGNGSETSIVTRLTELESGPENGDSRSGARDRLSRRPRVTEGPTLVRDATISSPRGIQPSANSEHDLEVIAELNRGGDPVVLFLQAERRRAGIAALVVALLLLTGVLGLLVLSDLH